MVKEYDLITTVNSSKTTTYAYYFHDKVLVSSGIVSIVDPANGIDAKPEAIKTGYTKVLGLFEQTLSKIRSVEAIDLGVKNSVNEGFVFGAITFSMSQEAQLTLNGLPNWSNDMFPCKWLGKREEDFTLTVDNKDAFYKAYITKLRDLKNNSGIEKLNVV